MNDSLIILGFTLFTVAFGAGCFALGRWDRRTIYTPGPPCAPPTVELYQGKGDESVRLVPRYPHDPPPIHPPGTVQPQTPPTSGVVFNISIPEGKDPGTAARAVTWQLARQMGTRANRWPPPGKDSIGIAYFINREEQEFWLEKLGDPTKKKAD